MDDLKEVQDKVGALIDGEGDLGEEVAEEQGVQEEIEEIAEEIAEEEIKEGDERKVEPTPEGDETAEFVDVEYDGQLYSVPPVLKDALLRNADYTQKTQDLAAQRKDVETQQLNAKLAIEQYAFYQEVQPVLLEVQQHDLAIDQYETYLSQNARDLSPQDLTVAQMEIKKLEKARQEKVASLQQKQNEFQQAREQSVKELLDKSTEVLRSKIQNWPEVEKEVVSYVSDLGFTEQQIETAKTDPRQLLLAHKAMLYDRLQAGKTAAVKAVQDAPAIKAKPRKEMSKDVQDQLNLRKKLKSNADPRDKAKAIEEHFGKKFA